MLPHAAVLQTLETGPTRRPGFRRAPLTCRVASPDTSLSKGGTKVARLHGKEMKTYHIRFFTHLLSILFTFSPRTQISVLNTMLVKAPPVSHVHVYKIYKTGVAFFVKGLLLASVPTFKIAKTENHCLFYGIFPIREMILFAVLYFSP